MREAPTSRFSFLIIVKKQNTQQKAEVVAKLFGALDKSQALERWMPDAFKHGACKVQILANAFMENPKIRFILGNGETRIFSLNEVPKEVRP
jgi:hypothetical protein